MARRFGSFDESDVRVRPGKGSRPRTKDRPKHKNAKYGMVITKDRGRWGVALDDGPQVTAMRARELGRTAIEVGDRVVFGKWSGSNAPDVDEFMVFRPTEFVCILRDSPIRTVEP